MTLAMPTRRQVTVTEPIRGGKEVIVYGVARRPEARMRSPFPPAWPWERDAEMRLLLAFVNIVAAHEGDADGMTAAYQSVLNALEDREQGRLSAADRQRDGGPVYRMPDEIRALFGQADPVRALLGNKTDHGFVEGLAGLGEVEMQVLWLHLHGHSRSAIALELVPLSRARRFGREAAVKATTVSQALWRARVKVRHVFRLQPESEAAWLERLDAEEAAAEEQKRLVDGARARVAETPKTVPWEDDPIDESPVEDEENPSEDDFLP